MLASKYRRLMEEALNELSEEIADDFPHLVAEYKAVAHAAMLRLGVKLLDAGVIGPNHPCTIEEILRG